MGIVNVTLAGVGPAVVPLSRGSRQLSAALEVLGRLQLSLQGLCRICCSMASTFLGQVLLLCPEIDDTAAGTRAFFRERKIL